MDLPRQPVDGYIATADIGGTRVRMLLARQDGTRAADWSTRIPDEAKAPDAIIDLLHAGLNAMLATVPAAPVLHMTVGAPGITDVERGVVLAAPNLPGWTEVPLRGLVESRFGVPAAVDNDTNLAALGEYTSGMAQGVDSLLFVALGTGVGSGIVLGGKLYRGKNGSAGEIGYLPVTGMPTEPLQMSRTGQLEGLIGGLGIEAHWKRLLRGTGREGLGALRAPQIFDLAEGGDTLAMEVLQGTAKLLADALCTVILVLDPAMIVLGGGVGSHRSLAAATAECLRDNEFIVPEIRSSALGTEAQLYGAVAVSVAALQAEFRC